MNQDNTQTMLNVLQALKTAQEIDQKRKNDELKEFAVTMSVIAVPFIVLIGVFTYYRR